MKLVKIIFVLLIAFNGYSIKAQVSSSYYSSISFSKIGVGYEFSNRLWSDIRMYGGLTVEDFTIEPILAYNYVSKADYDLYFGAGFTINYLTGPIFPIGLRIKPFEQYKNIKLHIEAEPNYNLDSEEILFYCSVGIRYVFEKKE